MCEFNAEPDFSFARYRRLMEIAKQQFEICNYETFQFRKSFLLVRHDVDFSLNIALEIAKIEAELGIKSTFFLNPHSDFYNLLEQSQSEIVKQIMALGHDLGLHFDAPYHEISSELMLENAIKKDVQLLEIFFETTIKAFSFHNPNSFELSCEQDRYAGLVNCYSARFKNEVGYCSDSNGIWRHENMLEVLLEGGYKCLQILTHPNWWRAAGSSPREKIVRAILGRARRVLRDYDKALAAVGRVNSSLLREKIEMHSNDFDSLFLGDCVAYVLNHRHQCQKISQDEVTTENVDVTKTVVDVLNFIEKLDLKSS